MGVGGWGLGVGGWGVTCCCAALSSSLCAVICKEVGIRWLGMVRDSRRLLVLNSLSVL